MDTPHARLKHLREELLHKTQTELANELGIKQSAIAKHESGRSPGFLKESNIRKLQQLYDVNKDWLLYGEGDPIIKDEPELKAESVHIKEIIDLDKTYPVQSLHEYAAGKQIRILPITVTPDERERITLVRAKVAAGYPIEHSNPEYIERLPSFQLPGSDFMAGTFRAFEVKGESMIPLVLPNSWVIGEYVENWFTGIKDGLIYIIVTKEGITIKKVLNRLQTRNQLVLQSENISSYSGNVELEDIIEVWKLKAELRFQFRTSEHQRDLRIAELEAKVDDLIEEMKRKLNLNNH